MEVEKNGLWKMRLEGLVSPKGPCSTSRIVGKRVKRGIPLSLQILSNVILLVKMSRHPGWGRQNQEILLYYYQMFMVHVILSMEEILHQLVGSLSQVVQEFFHQQYHRFFMVQHDIQSSIFPNRSYFPAPKKQYVKKNRNYPVIWKILGLFYMHPQNSITA